MNFSILCTILVAFGPETPEFTLLTIAPFAAIRHNRHITPNISECPGPMLTYFGLVGVLVGMIIPILVWQLPKGPCYGNRRCLLTSRGTTFTVCCGVRQRIGRS